MNTKNWYNSLNESLESRDLIPLWNIFLNISYGETVQDIVKDGGFYRLISIYRNNSGMYESPVTYITGKIKVK